MRGDESWYVTNTVISINPQAEIFADVQYSWKWRHVNMQGTLRTLIVGGCNKLKWVSFLKSNMPKTDGHKKSPPTYY